MANFIFNDFTTNTLQNRMILSSQQAFEVVQAMFETQAETPMQALLEDKTITPVNISLLIHSDDKDVLFFWLVNIKVGEQPISLILPIFLSQNEEEAARIYQKCCDCLQTGNAYYLPNKSFVLIQGKYYGQFFVDSFGNSEIKIFFLWASQKIVQEYFHWALNAEIGASLVKLTYSTPCTKDRYLDIAWLIACDGDPMLLPIDACSFRALIVKSKMEWQELETDTVFSLNGQKYKVSEDADNGQFLAKI